jgi:uncharacterized protein YacL
LLSYLIRIAIIAIFSYVGYYIGLSSQNPSRGLLAGLIAGFVINLVEVSLRHVKIGHFVGGLIGLVAGLAFGHMLVVPLKGIFADSYEIVLPISYAFFGYSGLLIGLYRGRSLSFDVLIRALKGQSTEEYLKILDTSVIIDGRIADVCESGFLDGVFIIPQFILQELQHIADSSDSLRRAKGRRGLDILHRIQKMSNINVRIVEEDFPKIKEVDTKLVALAKFMNAKIVTNDFNLNKVAGLQGVAVLNINELTNALKPVVLPGEILKVFVLKEGKEHNQGVAYLDDGTMVVIESGKKLIGKHLGAEVTSVLQTTAGRMIFAKPSDDNNK